jgi:tetratricopeptide (TPR) repeat protein
MAEALEELTRAAQDKTLAVASYSLIGQGYRQKRNHEEAAKWFEKGLAAAAPGTDQHYALAFELADIAEASDDRARAAALFREIRDWNPGYRNVSARLESLEKSSAG